MVKIIEKNEVLINLTWDEESQLFTPLILADALNLLKLGWKGVVRFSTLGVNKPGYNSVDQLDKALNLNPSRKVQILLHNYPQKAKKNEYPQE